MAEVIGKSLADLKKKLSTEEIINVARQVANGLQYLHANNITHRTLSDDNILIDLNGKVKLFNYGIFYMTYGGSEVAFPLG